MKSSFMSSTKRFFVALAATAALLITPAVNSSATGGPIGEFLSAMSVDHGHSSFVSPYGSTVPVKYFLPKGSRAAPAVIILHGSDGGSKYELDYEEVGRGLASQGYAAFIVYYYQGAPFARRPGPEDRMLPDPNAFFPWVATVRQSIGFVQTFPGVDPNRIGLFGMSLGGFVGSSVAVNNPKVKSLVVLSGGMPDQFADNMRFMPPTLIVHGDRDADVPIWNAYQLHGHMAALGLWNDLEVLPCEGHLPYHERNKEAVAAKVLAFFNRTL